LSEKTFDSDKLWRCYEIDPASALGGLALQLPFLKVSESMGNHDSKIVDAYGVD